MKRRLALVATLGALCVVSGCGLPSTPHFQRIPPKSVPFGLLAPSSSETPTPSAASKRTRIYLVAGRRLAVVRRAALADNTPAAVISLLLDSPTAEEAHDGFTTDIPVQTRLVSLRVIGETVTVDLSPQFGAVGGNAQILAVAQIVYTLTALPGIDAVRFAVNRHPIDVPDATGSLSPLPRTRAAYQSLLAAGSS